MTGPALLRIPKNATEEVRIELSEFKGHQLLNARVWWTPDDGTTWNPSKRGFALHVDALPELLAGLTALEAEAERRGWLEDSAEPRPRRRRGKNRGTTTKAQSRPQVNSYTTTSEGEREKPRV